MLGQTRWDEENLMIGREDQFTCEPNPVQKLTVCSIRLFDPSSKRTIVSRDVVFEENRVWDWNKTTTSPLESDTFSVGYNLIKEGAEERVSESNDINQVNEEDELGDEEDDNVEASESGQPEVRRSSRTVSKPAYLDDYILVAELECERIHTGSPFIHLRNCL